VTINVKGIELNRIDIDGKYHVIGELSFNNDGTSRVEFNDGFDALKGCDKNGLYKGMPFFLEDLRPSGFIGRSIAEKYVDKGFPQSISNWNHKYLLQYLQENQDNRGNIVIGSIHEETMDTASISDYDSLADKAIYKGVFGRSSVDGEQPKFTAYKEGTGHVIVKFIKKDTDPISQRMKDMLVCEHLSNKVLSENGFDTSNTIIHETDKYVFLESDRFDRVGMHGRSSMLSLGCVDAEYVGGFKSWSRTSDDLLKLGLIDNKTRDKIDMIGRFGNTIGNNDMHNGNLSLSVSEDGNRFELLPVYDMLPTCLMPNQNIIPDRVRTRKVDNEIIELALNYWGEVANTDGISEKMKNIAQSLLDGRQGGSMGQIVAESDMYPIGR